MALERKELLSLMKAAAITGPSKSYSFNGENLSSAALNAALREELNAIAGTYELYRKNHIELFELLEETLNAVVPKTIKDAYMSFAETKTYAQGDRPVFKIKGLGRQRAKQFVTRVGLAGLYETFKLGETWFEVPTYAIGGAARIGFEEFLDGRVDFSELVQLVMEGMDEAIYKEVTKALITSIDQLPAPNQGTTNGFNEVIMDRLVSIASAYGTPTIYCTREFAAKMIPAEGWISDTMRDTMWNAGYLGNYKGIRVVMLPQSLEDESNSKWVIDPGYAWVIPSDGNSKPVKIAFEGTMHMKDIDGYDWSREIHFYQKVGVSVVMTNNICVYKDTELAGQFDVVRDVTTGGTTGGTTETKPAPQP